MKVLKKNKLKIDPARAGAGRMVFDDEGVAMPPLAALAKQSKEVLNAPPGITLPDINLFDSFTKGSLESCALLC